jgi:hypothetical protein
MVEQNRGLAVGDNVYVVTAKGEKELHGSGTSLAPAELELQVNIDGKSTVAEIQARNRSLTVARWSRR